MADYLYLSTISLKILVKERGIFAYPLSSCLTGGCRPVADIHSIPIGALSSMLTSEALSLNFQTFSTTD